MFTMARLRPETQRTSTEWRESAKGTYPSPQILVDFQSTSCEGTPLENKRFPRRFLDFDSVILGSSPSSRASQHLSLAHQANQP